MACAPGLRLPSMRPSMNAAMTRNALRSRSFPRACALICLALFLMLQLLAVSVALHRAVHADAAAPTHHCAITLLAKGQVSASALAVALAVFAALVPFVLPPLESAALPASDYRLAPGRGPPFA